MSELFKEFLTFKLGKEEFGVEINRVQEIRVWQDPDPLPNVPPFVKGVVDLRGVVVPIIDLRTRFNLPEVYDATTVVIVVQVLTEMGERIVGMVVDAVSDVQKVDVNQLQSPPDINNSIGKQYVVGLSTLYTDVKQNDGSTKKVGRMVVIMDIDTLASDGLIGQAPDSSDDSAMPTGNG